jgi:hypothetical protein
VRIGQVTIIIHDLADGVKKHGAAIHHLFISDPTRVGMTSRRAFRVMQCLPDHGWWVNTTLKPVFRSAEAGERQNDYEKGKETAKFTKIIKY